MSQKRKVTLYFNAAMLSQTQREALRQDRSLSWIIQASWRLAREEVKRMPVVGPSSPPSVDAVTAVRTPVHGGRQAARTTVA